VWWNPEHLTARLGQGGIARGGELASPVVEEESDLGEVIAEVHCR
jgi:hypothetical protein